MQNNNWNIASDSNRRILRKKRKKRIFLWMKIVRSAECLINYLIKTYEQIEMVQLNKFLFVFPFSWITPSFGILWNANYFPGISNEPNNINLISHKIKGILICVLNAFILFIPIHESDFFSSLFTWNASHF